MRRLALLPQGHTRVAARYSPEELETANPQPAFSIEQSEDVDSSIAVIKSAARRSSAADYAIDLAVPLLVGVTTNSVGDELNRQSGRHGLRHELSHKEMAAVAVHETHEINRSHSYRRSLLVEPLAAPGGAVLGAVPSANTVSWPPSDV
jgi:hypothetical protein